jgi:hypothetical protein
VGYGRVQVRGGRLWEGDLEIHHVLDGVEGSLEALPEKGRIRAAGFLFRVQYGWGLGRGCRSKLGSGSWGAHPMCVRLAVNRPAHSMPALRGRGS